MLFTALSILGLSALSSAAAVPRSTYGSWDVTIVQSSYANGYRSQEATAVYTSDSYPDGITSKCKYEYNPAATPNTTDSCDQGFSYTYDSYNSSKCIPKTSLVNVDCMANAMAVVAIQQIVQEPSPNTTLFGNGTLELKSDAVGRVYTGEATIEVSAATA